MRKAQPRRRFSPLRILQELRARDLPHDPEAAAGVSWLDVVQQEASRQGAKLANVIAGSRRREDAAARAHAWRRLSRAGFTYSSIAAAWGADHTTVRSAILKIEGLGQ